MRSITESLSLRQGKLSAGNGSVNMKSIKPRFIVIEGVDGAGKTTQIKKLAQTLLSRGDKVYMTSEPTCKAPHAPTAVGDIIGKVLLGEIPMPASGMAALFLADRVLHNTDPSIGIKAALGRGEWVICDRYYYSSFAYQGKDTDLDWVIRQNLDCPDILAPDLCIFLDLEPEVAKRRRDTRAAAVEIFERPEVKASSIRDTFFAVFEKLSDNIKVINADGTVDEVAQRIMDAVNMI